MSGHGPRADPVHRARPLRATDWLRNEERLSLILMGTLLLALCIAGGASRAGETGQIVIRTVAITVLLILCATRRLWSVREVRKPMAMIAAAAAVCLIQLVPLPPALWTLLPGRAPFVAAVIGVQPWRPINLTPDAGLNALLSLSVPLAAAAILTAISARRRGVLADLLLAMMVIAALMGSLQLAGAVFDNPLINETVGEAAGIFANRNHQALLLACGMPLIARWAIAGAATGGQSAALTVSNSKPERRHGARYGWRGGSLRLGRMAIAAGLAAWLLLLVLATGSRAGLLLALAGLIAAAVMAWPALRTARPAWPRWKFPAIVLAAVGIIVIIVVLGLTNDRALAVRRLVASEDGAGIRASSLPILWSVARSYFPFGSGIGSFDPVFRIAEPFELLAPTYLNHAHNDVLEIVIEAGAAGLALALAMIVIWVNAGRRVWAARPSRDVVAFDDWALAFAGWSVLTMILAASLIDYPLRTPTIMVLGVIATWLTRAAQRRTKPDREEAGKAALPS